MEREKLIRVVARAYELVSNPETFTHRAYARTSDGRSVDPCSSDACRWDPEGALRRAACEQKMQLSNRALADLVRSLEHCIHQECVETVRISAVSAFGRWLESQRAQSVKYLRA